MRLAAPKPANSVIRHNVYCAIIITIPQTGFGRRLISKSHPIKGYNPELPGTRICISRESATLLGLHVTHYLPVNSSAPFPEFYGAGPQRFVNG
jgi:hypothetical protein